VAIKLETVNNAALAGNCHFLPASRMLHGGSVTGFKLRTLYVDDQPRRLYQAGGGWWPDIPRDAIDLLLGDNAPEDTQTGQGVTWSPTEEPSLWLRGFGDECQPDIPREADTTPTAAYTARGSPDLPRPEARSVDQRAAVIESISAELSSSRPLQSVPQ
jgi:hypothetical protein